MARGVNNVRNGGLALVRPHVSSLYRCLNERQLFNLKGAGAAAYNPFPACCAYYVVHRVEIAHLFRYVEIFCHRESAYVLIGIRRVVAFLPVNGSFAKSFSAWYGHNIFRFVVCPGGSDPRVVG